MLLPSFSKFINDFQDRIKIALRISMSILSPASLYSLISLPASCAEAAVPCDAAVVDSPQDMLALLQLQRHCHLMHLFISRIPELLGDVQASTSAVNTLASADPLATLFLGIAALRCFTQHNFTGPPLSGDLESCLQGFENVLDLGDSGREFLRDGGEEMHCPSLTPPQFEQPSVTFFPCTIWLRTALC
jgi:hypothetical protein